VNATICEAIRGRRLIMFAYADLIRVVEPHVYGLTTGDHEILSGWLRPGYSRTDPNGGWRTYRVADMGSVTLLPETFAGARPGYNPHDERMGTVYCSLPVVSAAP
jgi:hypothetical protein